MAKHHYVPKLYLRNFAHQVKKSERVYTSRRRRKTVASESIDKVACENEYYQIKSLENPLAWEENYANVIEPLFKNHLDGVLERCNSAVINREAPVISMEDKALFSWDIVFQMLRGPAVRDFLKLIYPDISKSVAAETKELLGVSDSSEIDFIIDTMVDSPEMFKHSSALLVMNNSRIGQIAKLIYDKTWVFNIAPDGYEWISSDNPIIAINIMAGKSAPMVNNLKQPMTLVDFPLSPKVLLEIYDYGFLGGIIRRLDRTRAFLNSGKDISIIDNRNEFQKEQCIEVFFSYSENVVERYIG